MEYEQDKAAQESSLYTYKASKEDEEEAAGQPVSGQDDEEHVGLGNLFQAFTSLISIYSLGV